MDFGMSRKIKPKDNVMRISVKEIGAIWTVCPKNIIVELGSGRKWHR